MIMKIRKIDKLFDKYKSDPKYVEECILLLKKEAECFLRIIDLLFSIKNDGEFDLNLPKLLDYSENIRSNKLNLIGKQFRFYEVKQQYYLNKLIDIIL